MEVGIAYCSNTFVWFSPPTVLKSAPLSSNSHAPCAITTGRRRIRSYKASRSSVRMPIAGGNAERVRGPLCGWTSRRSKGKTTVVIPSSTSTRLYLFRSLARCQRARDAGFGVGLIWYRRYTSIVFVDMSFVRYSVGRRTGTAGGKSGGEFKSLHPITALSLFFLWQYPSRSVDSIVDATRDQICEAG